MPWGRLAFAMVDTPFASALPYVGATGVSLLVALTGTLPGALALLRPRGSPRRRGRGRAVVGAAVLLPVAFP